jgi:hypothetical protein
MPQVELIRPLKVGPTGGSELTITNLGSHNAYYGTSPTVSSTNKTGNLAPNESLTLTTGTVWLVAETTPVILNLRENSGTSIASGSAVLGTDGTVGGPGGSPLSPTVVNGSQAGGGVVLEEWYFHTAKTTEDCTAELQEALTAANAANATLVLPNHEITLTGTVSLGNVTNHKWKMRGQGPGSVIIDANPTGPCLQYARTESFGTPEWRDFKIKLGVDKPAYNMVAFTGLETSHIEVSQVTFQAPLAGNYRALAAVLMENMWEGAFNGCHWEELKAHTVIYNCPSENGGNIAFNDCQDQTCQNGMIVKGADTTNNVQLKNTKFVSGGLFGGNYQFYEKLTAGIPAVGAKEMTVEAGLNIEYFRPNQAVLLYSAAGLDVLHLSTTAEPYNATTGVLKFRDEVTKKHSEYSDLRVISHSSWAIITDFYAPNMEILGGHFEQRCCFFKDAPGLYMPNPEVEVVSKANTGRALPFFLAGGQSSATKVERALLQHSTEAAIKAALLCPLTPAPAATSGTPWFVIKHTLTYTAGKAGMENEEYQPFWSPDEPYMSLTEYPQNITVISGTGGIERGSSPPNTRKYNGKTERKTGEEIEGNKREPCMISIIAVCKEKTQTKIEVLVNGQYAHQGTASSSEAGAIDISLTVYVPAGQKYEVKVAEGTVEKLFTSQIPMPVAV